MADVIKCPVCGESNLSDQEFCQYCQSRLQPLTGNLKGADAAIKPGQMPTKKNTAELEPILPQWLRDARDSARKSAEAEAAQAGRQPQESYSASSTPDLLAGLQSQAGTDDEDTPDWLANITGAAPKQKKTQADSPEVRWVELGGAKDFAQEEPEAEPYMPSWLEGITPTEPPATEKDELADWFRQTDDSQKPQQPEPQIPPFDNSFSLPAEPSQSAEPLAASSDTPDWLKKMAEESAQNDDALFSDSSNTFNAAPSSDTPDWLRQMAAEDGAQTSSTPSDAPDWLHQMAAEDAGTQNDNAPFLSADTFDAPAAPSTDAPDWLRAMGGFQDQIQSADSAAASEAGFGEVEAAKDSSTENVPEWMKDFSAIESKPPTQPATPAWLNEKDSAPSAETGTEVPSWLSNASAPQQEQAPAQDELAFGDIPGWLKAAAPQSSVYEGSSVEPAPAPAPSSDSPDWLNAFKSIDTPPAPPSPTEFPTEAPFEAAPPAFTADSQTSENMDALFTDMPDWLSSSTDAAPSTSPAASGLASSNPNADTIVPGELPSWVQAMRPVDTGSSQSSSSVSGDRTLESRGALAGLQGVLPSVPGFTPTSKPKAYSIKLQASEEQQAHAGLLEQILAAETQPVPIASFSALVTSRGLRWFLTAALFAVLMSVLFLRTQIFPMPVGEPPEIGGAIQLSQSIPAGAPVLVAFDYEPARVGEMEAAAAPIFNSLHQPSLTFISTNETGAALAERFISGPLADSDKSGFQYQNLGYLPGGQMGIRALAQNPAQTFPELAGMTSLSQFTALIIITDSADSARTWIEQTSFTQSAIPIVVITSAQAAPMIQPYYDSQQITGLVSGLYGGAVSEQYNKRNNIATPGITQTYWDAYSLGMLLAMALIVGGGLWNLALGLRNRAAGDAK